MIKVVIFDLAGVVIKGKVETFLEKGEKILGTKAKQTSEHNFDMKLNLGQSSERDAFERIFKKKMFDHEFIPLMKLWLSNWEIDEEVFAYTKRLKKKYKMAVVSNWVKSFEEKFDERLSTVFSPIIYSHRVRMVKPSKEIFELALEKIGIKAEECVFIDDGIENQKPCRELGIHFVLYKNLNKLKKDLELHGVRA